MLKMLSGKLVRVAMSQSKVGVARVMSMTQHRSPPLSQAQAITSRSASGLPRSVATFTGPAGAEAGAAVRVSIRCKSTKSSAKVTANMATEDDKVKVASEKKTTTKRPRKTKPKEEEKETEQETKMPNGMSQLLQPRFDSDQSFPRPVAMATLVRRVYLGGRNIEVKHGYRDLGHFIA